MSEPLRTCIATGQTTTKDGLIRFVIDPDGVVTPDLGERLPGRGYWLKADSQALEKAVRKKAFSRAARRSVTVPPDLGERVRTALAARVLQTLGRARAAGQVVSGFEKTRAGLKTGSLSLIFQAADASEDGRQKIRALAAAIGEGPIVVEAFDSAALAGALGFDHVVHIGVSHGGIARTLKRDAERLNGFRAPMLAG